MFIFGVCFVLLRQLIKLSAEKDIVYPGYIQGNCMFCNSVNREGGKYSCSG